MAKGILQIYVSIGQVILSADISETPDGFLAKFILASVVAGTEKNATGGKTGLTGLAAAVFLIGANAVGHKLHFLTGSIKKIKHLRRSHVQPMAIGVKVAASAASLAR